MADEFAGVDLGHVWRNERLAKIASEFAKHPDLSLPKLFPDPSELEAAYRFFSNPKFSSDAIIRSHAEESLKRAARLGRRVVAAHDISDLRWRGESREGLGHLTENGQGFLLHASLLIDPLGRVPLGVAGAQFWYPEAPEPGTTTRERSNAARRVPRSQKRSILWDRGVENVEELNAGRAYIVHVADREADDFALLGLLFEKKRAFVLRSQGERNVTGRPGDTVLDVANRAPVVMTREVPLSERRETKNGRPRTPREKRQHPARTARMANLEVRAAPVVVKKTPLAQTSCDQVELNLVLVTELDPPKGEEPITWLLYTSERVSTPEEVGWVVDAYVCRWRIEEFFKALKSGCEPEKKQLETAAALERVVAVLLPVAWRLLALRSLAQDPRHQDTPADTVFDPMELKVLRVLSVRDLPALPTLRVAYLAVAGVGGHLKRNGEPGWHTLGFGFQRLLDAVAVARALMADAK